VADLDLDAYAPAPASAIDTPAGAVVPDALAPAVAAAGPRAALVIVRNGRVSHIEVDPALAAEGLVVADGSTLDAGSVPAARELRPCLDVLDLVMDADTTAFLASVQTPNIVTSRR